MVTARIKKSRSINYLWKKSEGRRKKGSLENLPEMNDGDWGLQAAHC